MPCRTLILCVVPSLRRSVFLLSVACAIFLAGCRSFPTSSQHALPVTVRAAVPAAATATVVQDASAPVGSAGLRSNPLYLKAEAACKSHNYAKAARLLTDLSKSPQISTADHAFCLSQVDICRKDAGLPPLSSHVSPASQAVPTPIVAARPASSSDADCGPRALLSVCKALGVYADLPALRQAAGTTTEGTTMEGLAAAAKSLGLQTDGVQTGREALPKLRLPAIAWCNRGHFIAVLKLSGSGETGTATIRDPNEAHEETISQEVLLRRSGGYLLLVHR